MRRNLFQVIIFIMMLTMPAFAKDITPQAMQHYPVLTKEIPPSSNGMGKRLQGIDSVIENDVKRGFPGAVLLVAKDGKIIKETAYGWAKMYDQKQLLPEKKRQLMTVDTLFDIASNTKIYAAIFAFMRLTGEGKVRPDDLVSTYLPEFTSDGREKIRLCDLMDHTAGFSPEDRKSVV